MGSHHRQNVFTSPTMNVLEPNPHVTVLGSRAEGVVRVGPLGWDS